MTKLLGYGFDIVYKLGLENCPADALSRLPLVAYNAMTLQPVLALWNFFKMFYKSHGSTQDLPAAIQAKPADFPQFSIKDELFFYKGHVYIPPDSIFQPMLLVKFHNSPFRGHTGV